MTDWLWVAPLVVILACIAFVCVCCLIVFLAGLCRFAIKEIKNNVDNKNKKCYYKDKEVKQ